ISVREEAKAASIRKYSCSQPKVGVTFFTFLSKNLATSVAASSIANKARSKGALLSKASPVYDTKTVGIHKVVPKIKAGDVGSQAVYPRASKVFRIPRSEEHTSELQSREN